MCVWVLHVLDGQVNWRIPLLLSLQSLHFAWLPAACTARSIGQVECGGEGGRYVAASLVGRAVSTCVTIGAACVGWPSQLEGS